MLIWDEARHALGVAAMDNVHQEFLALAAETQRAGPEDFPLLFEGLRRHTREHFEHEGQLMRSCGFAAIAEHEDEHRRVLGHLDRLAAGIEEGRIAMARIYVREGLRDWFPTHLATMDAALAACVRRHDTVPVKQQLAVPGMSGWSANDKDVLGRHDGCA